MSRPVNDAIREILEVFEERDGFEFGSHDVAKEFEQRFPVLFREDADAAQRGRIVDATKRLMKSGQLEDDGIASAAASQLSLLPGHVQRFYCIGQDSDYRWIAFRSMRREHWHAAEQVLVVNVSRASARLEEHQRQMDALRPWWNKMPSATTEEILTAAAGSSV